MSRQAERSESLTAVGARPAEPDAPAEAATGSFELRPHGVGELLDVAVDTFRGRVLAILGLGVGLLLPRAAWEHWIHENVPIRPWVTGGNLLGLPWQWFASRGLFGLSAMLVTAATGWMAFALLQGREPRLRAALAAMARRFPHVVAVSMLVIVLAGLPLFGGSVLALGLGFGLLSIGSPLLVPVAAAAAMLALVPGLFLYWRLMLASTVVVLERVGVFGALRRSVQLTRGMLARGLAVLVLGVACLLPVNAWSAVLDHPDARGALREALAFAPAPASDLLLLSASLAFEALSVGFWGVLLAVLYVETRVRREGFDLAVRLRRLRRAAGLEGAGADRARTRGTAWAGRA